MAKKKGVPARMRKPVKRENKFIDMPKDQLIKWCVIVGAVILAAVLFFVLRGALDGHLAVRDGAVVTEGDNWIIGNTGTTDNPRYFKVGEVGEVEGFAREANTTILSDNNVAAYYYRPEDEASNLEYVATFAVKGEYDQMAQNAKGNYATFFANAEVGEVVTDDVEGISANGFGYTYSTDVEAQEATETTEATPAKTTYAAGWNTYLKAGHGLSIVVQASAQTENEAELPTQEELRAAVAALAKQITFEK